MSTISLRTKFPFFAFMLLLFPAKASIDGAEPQKVGWGESQLSVAAGTHTIEVFFPYLFIFNVGKAQVSVTLSEGQSVTLQYKAPWLVFLPGKLQQVA
ncbi:MAG TPA: hypothetical protein VGN69_05305 [Solirubrobacteraceae bacterium]|jgi:hypothetical protein|nr:hypothetical protein [Solirubrobacteraceae bacterium]